MKEKEKQEYMETVKEVDALTDKIYELAKDAYYLVQNLKKTLRSEVSNERHLEPEYESDSGYFSETSDYVGARLEKIEYNAGEIYSTARDLYESKYDEEYES